MSDDKPDTTSMTGAEFRREVGVDPAEWAEAFLAVYDEAFLREGDDPLIDREERAGFTAAWFRDYGEAAVAHAQATHQKILAERLVPRQSSE